MPEAKNWGKNPRKNQAPLEDETFISDRTGTTKRLNLNMPFELHTQLKVHCVRAGVQITDVVIQMIKDHLAK